MPHFVGRFVYRRPHAKAARDVAQHVDALEALDRGSHGRLDLGLVEHVCRRKHPTLIRASVDLGQFLPAATEEHQICPALEERLGHGQAEIAGCAGHENCLLGKSHIGPRLSIIAEVAFQ